MRKGRRAWMRVGGWRVTVRSRSDISLMIPEAMMSESIMPSSR